MPNPTSPSVTGPPNHAAQPVPRLLTLDAMRGVAAIMVVVFHLPDADAAPSGYLAVDFFFLLSGFVIARTYDRRIAEGLTFFSFAALRGIRLYPIYFVGFLLGLLRCIGQVVLDRPDKLTLGQLTLSVLLEVFLLPSPSGPHLFSLNGPSWSLFLEMTISLAYGSILVKLRQRVLWIIVAISGVLLVWVAASYGSLDVGFSWEGIHDGFVRVIFSFATGILVARNHHANVRRSWLSVALAITLTVLLSVSLEGPARVAYDLLFAAVLAPLLVWCGASYDPPPALRAQSRYLGDLSYPIYALHYPLLWMFGFASRKVGAPSSLWVPVVFVLIVLTAWGANRFWDKPIRAKLGAFLLRKEMVVERHREANGSLK